MRFFVKYHVIYLFHIVHVGGHDISIPLISCHSPPHHSIHHSFVSFIYHIFFYRFPEHVVKWFGSHLVLALGYLHSNHIVFRNLSPENIYIDGKNSEDQMDYDMLLS